MADVIDTAAEAWEVIQKHLIANAAINEPLIQLTGKCHNCGEKVKGKFCDSDCRDDFEKRRKRNGS